MKAVLNSIKATFCEHSFIPLQLSLFFSFHWPYIVFFCFIMQWKITWGGFNLEYGDLENGNPESQKWLSQNPVLSDPIACPSTNPPPLNPTPTPDTHRPTHAPRGGGPGRRQGFFEITVSRRQIWRKLFSRCPYSRLMTFPKLLI